MASSQEKFQARQEELVQISRKLIIEDGFSNFSIEKIALASGYSRPTVYQHFASKSDAVEAVANRMLDNGNKLLMPLSKLEGSGRERCMAILYGYELFARFYPEDFYLEDLFGYSWFRDVVPEKTNLRYFATVDFFHETFCSCVADAEAAGDLHLPESGPDAKALGHIIPGQLFGLYAGVTKKHPLCLKGEMADPWTLMRKAMHATLDGLIWHPLSTEFDYEAHYQHILKTLYPQYWLNVQTAALAREVGLENSLVH